jgi:ornithine cyclodeaminase
VVARDAERAQAFAHKVSSELGRPVAAARDIRDALEGADIVVTATTATTPVLRSEWLGDGVHLNAVGACVAGHRELDAQTVARARFFTDRRESAQAEAGDFVIAAAELGLPPEHIVGELGELVLGRIAGRQDATQLTIFKSLGLAAEDLAAAALIHERGLAVGAGTEVAF